MAVSVKVTRGKGSKQSTKRYMRKAAKPRALESVVLKARPTLTASDERRIDRFVDWFVDRMFGDRA